MPIIKGDLFIDGENPIQDNGSGGHTITNTSVSVSELEKKFLNSSMYFNGASHLSIPAGGAWNFGLNDFTIDFWYMNKLPGSASFVLQTANAGVATGYTDWQIAIVHDYADGAWAIYIGGNSLGGVTPGVSYTNTWMHVAITRSSGTIKAFINGVEKASNTSAGDWNINSTRPLLIGGGPADHAGYQEVTGNIDNLRIVNGQALWTENFTVDAPSAPYDMFYEVEPVNDYVRPDSISGLYDMNVNIRGAGKTCTRPTLSQFFKSHLYYFCQGFFPGTGLTGQAYETIAEADANPLTVNLSSLAALNDTVIDTYDFGDGTQMSYLNLDLSSLGNAYEVSLTITSANGSVNLLGWDGTGDGSNHNIRISSSPGGNVTLEIKVIDTPDLENPTVVIDTPTSNVTYYTQNTSVDVAGTATDNVGISSVTWSNSAGGSGSATGTNNWSANSIALSTGENIITVTVTDTNSNVNTDIITVYKDDANPVVTIDSPTTNATHTTDSDTISLGGTASDNYGITAMSWENNRGGNGSVTGTSNWTTGSIALAEGDNTLTVTAYDVSGRYGTDSIVVTYNAVTTYPGYTDTTEEDVHWNLSVAGRGTWDGTKWNSELNGGQHRIFLSPLPGSDADNWTKIRIFHNASNATLYSMLSQSMIMDLTGPPYVSESEWSTSQNDMPIMLEAASAFSITKIEVSYS